MDTPGEAANERTLSVLEEIYQTGTNAEQTSTRRQPRLGGKMRWDRISAPFAIAVALFALAVGAVQMRSNIHFPTSVLPQVQPSESLRDLQSRFGLSLGGAGITDTDGDGLFDADETKTYGSSPYLEDTDSDGTSDGDEVKAKTDPNCPTGQTCGSLGLTAPPQAAPSVFPFIDAAGGAVPPPAVGSVVSVPSFNAARIREQLIAAGVSADLVSGFSDQQLESVYQEAVAETAVGTAGTGAVDRPVTSGLPEAGGFRALLLKAGLPQETLNQLSDQELEQLVSDVIREQQTGP